MEAVLARIDLSEQAVLLSQILRADVHLATCSTDGQLVSCSAADAEDFADQHGPMLHDMCNDLVLGTRHDTDEHDNAVIITPLLDVDHGTRGWVCLICRNGRAAETETIERGQFLLQLLADHIVKLCKYETELSSFAEELSARYDELNLVYDADRTIEAHHLESEILSGLLEHCIQHLQISAALIYVPEKHIELLAESEETPGESVGDLAKMGDTLLRLSAYSKSCVVLNSEADLAALGEKVSSKIMAAPIVTARGTIEGTLCVAKATDAEDFSNSDRNLLDVMSRRITQVLQSSHDELTGTFNRASFEKHVEQCIAGNRLKRAEHCLFNVDLDDFHVVNETYGFSYGDEIIRLVAQLLESKIRDDDILARIGANEFGILLRNCPSDAGEKMARKICKAINGIQMPDPSKPIDLSASIGISVLGSPLDITGDMISRAELACQEAKSRGKNCVFNPHAEKGTIEERRKQVSWISVINAALAQNDFRLYAQKIERIKHRPNEVHFEVLLRLEEKSGNILSPFAFLPAAERYRLMPKIDRWVVQNTFACLAKSRDAFAGKSVKAAINLSGQSLSDEKFPKFLRDALARYDIPSKWICLEVTESAAISNIEHAQNFMSELSAEGVSFSLDDFGTGLSSFEYLKTLKVNYLKIDGFFVKQILDDPVSAAIVSAMSQVAKSMELETVAEFVAEEAIKRQIYYLGVDFAQGYSIGKPIPIADFIATVN